MSEKEEKEVKHLSCEKKCCTYSVIPYKNVYYSNNIHQIQSKIKKAGCFIYDKNTNKVLLVQSRGQMWGPPKGTVKPNEPIIDCAIREVEEETGIKFDESLFKESDSIIIKSKAQYFFVDINDVDIKDPLLPQTHIADNDANGIGWFHIDCINSLIFQGKISINQHCRMLIKKIFDIDINFN